MSIAVRKYPVTSRTWKSSSLAAKVVPGELGVRIARCTLHFIKKSPLSRAFLFFGNMFLLDRHNRLLKRFLVLLITYSFLRIGYYFYHLNVYRYFTQDEIFQSFFLGIRFDIAAICLLNIPIIILALFQGKNSKLIFFERLFFIVINSAGIIASLVDFELFLFMGKRLSFDLFVITDDIWDQLPQLILNYWYFPLLGLFFGIGYFLLDKKFLLLNEKPSGLLKQVLSGFLLLTFSFVGIRGGLQHKSINVQTAFMQGKNELGHLVLNTPYHFLRTLKNQTYQKLKYFVRDEEAINLILNRRDFRELKIEKKKKNIVLIVLESFSSEYVEKGYTPFLDFLISKSLYFPHHLANGRRSIEALPSLLCGLPSLIDEPISKSVFQGNRFVCMPKILKSLGYTNYFFHGGARGTMGFESYTLSNGFDQYFSKENYSKGDFDGTWGIYDGPYLEYVASEINKMPEPFLAGIFTLSSHQPYSVPRKMKGKFPKGKLEIHESIGYTDFALRNFFEKIKNEPWYKETIFFITADHTSKLESKKYQNLIGHYRVPFLIYGADLNWGEKGALKVTQHSDIPRTILGLVGASADEMPATAADVLGHDKGYAINYADGRDYFLASGNEVQTLSKEQVQKIYTYDWDSGELKLKGDAQDLLLKAYLQYFINGLINNNLSIYR